MGCKLDLIRYRCRQSDPLTLIQDAMWVDDKQRLWMPAAQLNRGYPFHNGVSQVVKPLYVFSIDIGIGPSPIDHP